MGIYYQKMKEIIFLGLIFLQIILCEKDLYKSLEIKRSATQPEMKKKYRELTRKYHPDRNRGDEKAKDKFTDVAEAYEVLSDPKKRRSYDRGGMEAVKQEAQMQEQGGHHGGDPFGDMFGHGHGHQQQRRDKDVKIKIRVSLKDLYLGKEFDFTLTRSTTCPHCRGNGAESHEDIAPCNHCGGQGTVRERQEIAPGFVQMFESQCPVCKGKGKRITKECHVCHGNKIVKGLDELTLYIEKGMKNGSEIKFDDYGEERVDISPGSLIFVVKEIADNDYLFLREGDNLHYEIYVHLKGALLGFKQDIKHLDDHIVKVSRDGITQPGTIIKIKGEGMPKHQRGEKGDLFVKVNVLIPSELDEKQKEIAKILFDKRSYW